MTPLTVDDIVSYLLRRGLVTPADLVEDGLVVKSALRRNHNLRVERADGGGYLIKQADPRESDGARTLAHEARFYAFCREEPRAAPVAAFLPPFNSYDTDRALLVLELVEGRSLQDELDRRSAEDLPVDGYRGLGRALGTLHATFHESAFGGVAWPREIPAALRIHRPGLAAASRLSNAQRRLLRIVQSQDGMAAGLDGIAEAWRVETVVHGDVRADNVVIGGGTGEDVYLVDWEYAGPGDPAWDVAGVLAGVILCWIRGMPRQPGLTTAQRLERCRYPLAALRPLVAAFEQAYRAAAAPRLVPDLPRASRLSAARLLQSAYEYAWGVDVLPPTAVWLLQTSANILQDPDQALGDLYGL